VVNRVGGKWSDWEDDLTGPVLEALHTEWEELPPTAASSAAAIGFKPKEKGDLMELLARFPDGRIRMN